jgi:hypothetical protein
MSKIGIALIFLTNSINISSLVKYMLKYFKQSKPFKLSKN